MIFPKLSTSALATPLGLVLAASASAQTTWFVDAAAPGPGTGAPGDPYASIQYAIDRSSTLPGDTLQVAAGTYFERVDPGGKDLLIDGSQAGTAPIIDAGGAGSAFTFTSDETAACELRRVELQGGAGTSFSTSSFGPSLAVGGGAFIDGASPTFTDCTFVGHSTEGGAAAYITEGSARFTRCSFLDNVVMGGPGFGGALWLDVAGAADVQECTFTDNLAMYFGGGGAIYVHTTASGLTALGSTFDGNACGDFNSPGTGGAIWARGAATVTRCSFHRNGGNGTVLSGAQRGGAADGGEYFDCTFTDNRAQVGGGLSSAMATGCRFYRNDASEDGSGSGGAAMSCTLIDCDLVGNYACGEGGGATASNLSGCRVLNNAAIPSDNSPGYGGGLSTCTATGCEIRGNRSTGFGQATFDAVGGGAFASTLERCVIVNNFAEFGAGSVGGSSVNCTFARNVAQFDVGGLSSGVHENDIAWGNLPNSSDTLAVFRYSNVEGGAPGTGNISADPLFFGPAGSDHHLMTSSPCIDSGDPMAPLDPDGSRSDMGALPFDTTWAFTPGAYCTASPSFLPCLPSITVMGEPSLGAGPPVELRATDVPPSTFGLMVHSTSFAFTPLSVATNETATLCVGSPLIRNQVQMSTPGTGECSGTFSQELLATDLMALGLQPGDRLYAQFWFRLAFGRFGLTDGAEMVVRN